MSEVNGPKRVSRRSVAKGAAWAVPAVAVVASAPMAAASAVEPTPGDHCYQGGQSGNAFRFYLLQPTQVGDVITLSGAALKSTTTVVGYGLTVAPTTGEDGTVSYIVTAVDPNVTAPFILISDTNTTGGAQNRMLTVTQRGQSWTKDFASNTINCQNVPGAVPLP